MEEMNFKKSTVTIKSFFSVRRLTVMAMMTALTIIVARFCAIPINEGLRLSFESIPVILTAVWMGPISGMLVGGLADLVGTLINAYGGAYFPPLTVTPMLIGLISGLMAKYVFRNELNFAKMLAVVLTADIIGSTFYGSIALTWYYQLVLDIDKAFAVVFVARLTKFLTYATDIAVVWVLHKAMYQRIIRKML